MCIRDRVGGAPVTQDFADEMGADAYGENAVDAVDKAKELIDLLSELKAAGFSDASRTLFSGGITQLFLGTLDR